MSDTDQDKVNPVEDAELNDTGHDPESLAPPPSKPSPYDVPLDQLLSDEANPLTPEDIKKLKQIGFGLIAAVLVIIVLAIYGCQPKKASMAYGICSTFLELNTPYPHTLKYIGLEGSKTAVRIYFTSTDPFGQYKQEMIECKFGPDAKMGMKITEILRNRRQVDSKIIQEFNLTLPTIMASDPYLVMPGPDWKNPLVPD